MWAKRRCRLALILLFAPLLALGAVRRADAQDALKIAAVINEDVVTELDVFVRLRMAMLTSRIQDTPETRQRLLPQVLRSLIDEHLKRQAAEKQGINNNPGEIERRINELAQRNHMSRADFEQMLNSNGVLIEALADQIDAELSWARLVQKTLRPKILISDEEINEELARISAASGQPEYRLSVIYLAVDRPDQDATVRQSAERLAEQLGQGADFESLAREFSQDQSAASGGDMGWVRLDQLEPSLAAAVSNLARGQVAGPVPATGGYYVLRMSDIRQSSAVPSDAGAVSLRQILWSLPGNAAESEVKKATDAASAIAAKVQSCADMERLAPEALPAIYRDLGSVVIGDLPPILQPVALNQPIGQASAALRTDGGIGIYAVCDRGTGSDDRALSRVAIAERLGRARLETLARGYLSDLRRTAFIDIRL